MTQEALKLALEALEQWNTPLYKRGTAITAIKEALAQLEPMRLRRGDILRSIETDELCTVWSTSTTGKTLIKWGANDFCGYTAEQIGELFWLEPSPDDLELSAEKSDNYTTPPQRKPLTDEQILALNFDGEFCLITDDDEVILDFARLVEAAHGIKGDA